jgi:hypothetical protein
MNKNLCLKTKCCGKFNEPEEDEVLGEFKTTCKEELHDLYRSPSNIRTVKSRR